jgi:hypothetical protein
MQSKNARQHVEDVRSQLQSAQGCLNQALSSVEKTENRQKIQDTLNAVNTALQSADTTLSSYRE